MEVKLAACFGSFGIADHAENNMLRMDPANFAPKSTKSGPLLAKTGSILT